MTNEVAWFYHGSRLPVKHRVVTRLKQEIPMPAYLYPITYNPPLDKSLTIKAAWRHFQLVWRNKNSLQGLPLIYAGY